MSEADYRRDVGAFFKSMHGTLNHLLLTDRLWLKRLTGEGEHPNELNAIIYEDRRALAAARADEDDRIVRYVASLDEAALDGPQNYTTTSGKPFEQKRCDILAHLFNHQTHHRGQAHTILSICTGREPPQLDLLLMQRGTAAPDLRAMAKRQLTDASCLGRQCFLNLPCPKLLRWTIQSRYAAPDAIPVSGIAHGESAAATRGNVPRCNVLIFFESESARRTYQARAESGSQDAAAGCRSRRREARQGSASLRPDIVATRRADFPRGAKVCRHCERSEAIQGHKRGWIASSLRSSQ